MSHPFGEKETPRYRTGHPVTPFNQGDYDAPLGQPTQQAFIWRVCSFVFLGLALFLSILCLNELFSPTPDLMVVSQHPSGYIAEIRKVSFDEAAMAKVCHTVKSEGCEVS